jgi:TRAP-type mannitol/chloroaromatic compound transport system permease small subunit
VCVYPLYMHTLADAMFLCIELVKKVPINRIYSFLSKDTKSHNRRSVTAPLFNCIPFATVVLYFSWRFVNFNITHPEHREVRVRMYILYVCACVLVYLGAIAAQ